MANTIDIKDAANATVTVATNDAVKTSVDAVKTSVDALKTVTSLGAKAIAASAAVNIASDQIVPVDQKSTGHDVQLTVTRPANVTPYTAGDVVGGALTFAAMGKAAGTILLTRSELEIDIGAIPSGMTSFRLYLYSVTPPSALADNAPFTFAGTDRASFLGYLDLGNPVLIGATLYCEVSGISKQMKLAGTDLFGYMVTNGAFTPAANSEVYKPTLHSVEV